MPVMILTGKMPVPPDFRNISGRATGELITPRGGLYDLSGCVDIGVNVGADGMVPNGSAAALVIESGVAVFETGVIRGAQPTPD